MKNSMKIMIAVLATLAFAGSALAQPRNFRHEHIIATMGFEGDGASITNINPANVVGGALVGSDISSTVQAYSANLTTLAANNGVSLTNIPAAGIVGTALVSSAIGSTVQAHSSALDALALNNGGNLTNVTVNGGTVGGHTFMVWNGPTCSVYAVDSTGTYTNWQGDVYP